MVMEPINGLEFQTLTLTSVDDIVRFDFIAQKSISHLDLNNREYSRGSRSVITHEGFRKTTVKSRKVIYNLHIDLPVSMEQQLVKVDNLYTSTPAPSFHVSKICILEDYFPQQFAAVILSGVEKSTDKMKVVENYFMGLRTNGRREGKIVFRLQMCCSFLNILMEERDDSRILAEFLNLCGRYFAHFIIECENTTFLEYILRNSHRMRINIWQHDISFESLLNYSIRHGKLDNVAVILQYEECVRSYPPLEYRYLPKDAKKLTVFTRRAKPSTREILLFQLRHLFRWKNEYPTESREALRLIWRSISNPYLSQEEIFTRFPDHFFSTEVWSFYKNTLSEDNARFSTQQPRTLSQYCRCAIRRVLSGNHALPSGIKNLGLPNRLQSYLNLES